MRIKIITALLISLIPAAGLRRLFYSLLLGYTIPASTRIGFMTVIAVSKFELGEGVKIGMLNLFKGPINVRIGDNSRIGKLNKFTCALHIKQEKFHLMNYTPIIDFGASTLVLDGHFFDVYGKITLGEGSWVAGHGSEFWTHGLSIMDRDIAIGKKTISVQPCALHLALQLDLGT